MSRLTSAQVIQLGHYLDEDFDPAALTVAQLLGVFGYHNVNYPSQYTKPKLIQVYEDQIRPRASKLRREKLKQQNSVASNEGIVDGLTGEPLGGRAEPRRSSRRPSRAPPEDADNDSPLRPEPKRRRSSAEPTLGRPSRKSTMKAPAPVVVVEESEPEEEELPARKVVRRKKTGEDAAVRARRPSSPDSGWEDHNIFQSGAESSSPVRPSPAKPKPRKSSLAPRTGRKSTSVPPQFSPPSPERAKREANEDSNLPLSPIQRRFAPKLPESILEENTLISPPKSRRSGRISIPFQGPLVEEEVEVEDDEVDFVSREPSAVVDDPQDEEVVDNEELEQLSEDARSSLPPPTAEEAFAVEVSRRIAKGDSTVIHLPAGALPVKPLSTIMRVLILLSVLLGATFTTSYKSESASIGYCDAGRDTSASLQGFRARQIAIEACNMDNATHILVPDRKVGKMVQLPCPAPNLTPGLGSIECTPCPKYATCAEHTVVCDAGYILRSHPLLSLVPPVKSRTDFELNASSPPTDVFWKAFNYAVDGLPGLGSVAFAPRCIRDPQRDLHIGALGRSIEKQLAAERGNRLCSGPQPSKYPDAEGGEAREWGLSTDALKAANAPKSTQLQLSYDGVFEEAVQQIVQWSEVRVGEDQQGKRYLAHSTPRLDMACAVKLKSKNALYQSRGYIMTLLSIISAIYYLKNKLSTSKADNARVAELVQVALDSLRNQELAHHTDPVSAPHPYLSSVQLRDLILQSEHAVSARRKLWDRVEKIVEENANVRTNLQETNAGDELRVWRWVGTSTGTPRGVARRQLLFKGINNAEAHEDGEMDEH